MFRGARAGARGMECPDPFRARLLPRLRDGGFRRRRHSAPGGPSTLDGGVGQGRGLTFLAAAGTSASRNGRRLLGATVILLLTVVIFP